MKFRCKFSTAYQRLVCLHPQVEGNNVYYLTGSTEQVPFVVPEN
jgi:hypothetical protein